MGAASYQEDIIDRWTDSFALREQHSLPPGMYEPQPPTESGWVRLTHQDGLPIADRFVPVVGEWVDASVEREKPHLEWKVEIEPVEGQPVPNVKCEGDELHVSFGEPGLYKLTLACGGYFKTYEVSVLSERAIDSMPVVAAAYDRLIERPESWTEDRIHRFLEALQQARNEGKVPSVYANGLFEYHLALYLADRNVERSHQCFADAYRMLRPFAGVSPIAQFVVDYILFRKNCFEGHGKGPPGTRFGGLRQFFVTDYERWRNTATRVLGLQGAKQFRICLLPIDQHCLRIIETMHEGHHPQLKAQLRGLQDMPDSMDLAERGRVGLVLARGYRFLGNLAEARRHYALVSQVAGERLWTDEANDFLQTP